MQGGKPGAPLRARSCALVSGLVLLWCLPMERVPNAAERLNAALCAPYEADQRAAIELPRAPTPLEDAVPTRLPEQRTEGTSGSCSAVPLAPPFPLALLQLVLLAVIAWWRAPRGDTSTARAVLLALLCLFAPRALAQQCSSAPTCPSYSAQSGLALSTCRLTQYNSMMDFDGGYPVAMPGRGVYRIFKVSKDESNCCYDLEVHGFMCEVMKNKTAVRASPALLLLLLLLLCGSSVRTALSPPTPPPTPTPTPPPPPPARARAGVQRSHDEGHGHQGKISFGQRGRANHRPR